MVSYQYYYGERRIAILRLAIYLESCVSIVSWQSKEAGPLNESIHLSLAVWIGRTTFYSLFSLPVSLVFFRAFIYNRILILKHKQASFLQVYHHTGIVLIMWMAVCSQAAWLQFAVILNSVIHTLMYT